MNKIISLGFLFIVCFLPTCHYGQETDLEKKRAAFERQKEQILQQEKGALKEAVMAINEQLEKEEITEGQAQALKEEAAKKHALNIENRLAILENKMALLERNGNLQEDPFERDSIRRELFEEEKRFLGLKLKRKSELPKKDKKTKSNLVFGVGLYNHQVDGEFFDPNYSVFGSRYFEFGIMWNTRLSKNSNWLRLNYGLLFNQSGLRSREIYLVPESSISNSYVDLDNFHGDIRASKVRFDSFELPILFEFGPSSKKQFGEYIRYSTKGKLRIGVGANLRYLLNRTQVLIPRGMYFGNDLPLRDREFIRFGFTGYIGRGSTLFVLKWENDYNTLSGPSLGERRSFSLGLRFEL